MGLFDFLGIGNKENSIQEFIKKGAIIIDVRSVSEFNSGHIMNAKNIPLNNLESKIDEIKKWNKPIIACCLSGMRSAQATSLLKQNKIQVINGGGWQSLKSKL
ncbi:rhodanese-like domain-containing protein [Flavobacterium luteum]|uniref:Rhodanese-like domain-containing protein n=1 Tax=Flavobacterium luteum TaxID=2026654 RepID=A0A7J5AHY0_9FLAO|nr:rhodanese-like domain-containing protein [Flavobacterium luteum]KAB1156609.1 rhodanese-like domain-containing protein [Flavobacterium luteum]